MYESNEEYRDRLIHERSTRAWKWAVVIFLLILAVAIAIPILINGAGSHYSLGDRTGVVTKFSRKGLIFKSWEGELQIMGINAQNVGLAHETWSFSVQDDTAAKQVSAAMQAGAPVVLDYHEYLIRPRKLDTSYVVDGVQKK